MSPRSRIARLALRGAFPDVGDAKAVYLEFDVPPNALSVELRMYQFDMNTNDTVTIHDVLDSWQEDTITWNNWPATDATELLSFPVMQGSSPGGEEYKVDITSIVTPGQTANLQLRIMSRWGSFYSSDHDNPDLRPRIVLTTDSPLGTGFLRGDAQLETSTLAELEHLMLRNVNAGPSKIRVGQVLANRLTGI